jgi:hypothetical protein
MIRPSRGIALPLALAFAVAFSLVLVSAGPASAATSAVGLVDFSSKTPNFKNGDWVRYHFKTETSSGEESEGYQEMRIVGEETYRGEKCFWLETGVGRDTMSLFRTLMLVSYEAFKDPNADVRFKRYMRLFMMGPSVNQSGPEILEVDHPKEDTPPTADEIAYLRGKVDTLGAVTVDTPRGPIASRAFYTWRKLGATEPKPDSTVVTITDTKRTVSKSRKVPITSQSRFEQTETILRKAYAAGQVSTEAPENVLSWTKIDSKVVAWGKGATNLMLEAWRQQGSLLEAPVNSP